MSMQAATYETIRTVITNVAHRIDRHQWDDLCTLFGSNWNITSMTLETFYQTGNVNMFQALGTM